MARPKKEESGMECAKGLAPYIVHTPFKKALLANWADSKAYARVLEAEKSGDLYVNPEYLNQLKDKTRAPIPEHYHNDRMYAEAVEEAKKKGMISDDDGRFWCWTEAQAAFVLLHYFSIDPYLKKFWPYSHPQIGVLYLDAVSPKFQKPKDYYLKEVLSEEELEALIQKKEGVAAA